MTERRKAGFTMVETLTVLAAMSVVAVTAIPNIINVISITRTHASMTSLSGMVQSCRMYAVKSNKTMSMHMSAEPYGLVAYVKPATDISGLTTSDPQVQLQAPIARMTAPSGPDAPPALDNTALGFTPRTSDPSFNSRGMPCAYTGGFCIVSGFRYYFKDSRAADGKGWSAVSISPAGRVKKWFWNGSAWID